MEKTRFFSKQMEKHEKKRKKGMKTHLHFPLFLFI